MGKKIVLLIAICLFVSGCTTNKEVVSEFEESLSQIETSIHTKQDWASAETEVKKLIKSYNDNLWKMQLLGDENEYEVLKEDINLLIASIKAQDTTQAFLNIASIKSNITSIFKGNKLTSK